MTVRLLLTTLVVMLGAVPVQAQLAPGYSGYSSAPRQGVDELYWRFLDQVGPCLANQKPEDSEAFIDTAISSEAEEQAFDHLFNVGRNRRNNCLGRFSGVYGAQRAHLRASVAEGLFEKLSDETIEALIASPPAAPVAIASLHDIASCYVANHAAEARELLRRTDIATEGELQFISERVEDFGACFPADRELSLDATTIRMAVAEAAYRAATGRPVATIEGRD
ncbi:hypothetical protein [Aurantiacibacter sp. D1-12]|uniref:hypothetical protein n=1 Tax=Aurantiacibacter sp. D1-12 TaxID=2993658 RepID=UPI00237D197E|nr:hypothetical protein [Aurantiacibacter sp. D1-12]MDE1466621.1 hypothetical protein [Aurantiacibacter sp. D1-12]